MTFVKANVAYMHNLNFSFSSLFSHIPKSIAQNSFCDSSVLRRRQSNQP